jgi:Zn-dependent peptidase ImmA (M78 family)
MNDAERKVLYITNDLRERIGIEINQKIDFTILLNFLGIKLIYRELGNGIYGACKTKGVKRLIVLKPNIEYECKKKFILAHEIGHILLHQTSFLCISNDFDMWRSKTNKEFEANIFAAELLLPKKIVIDKVKKKGLSFSTIKNLVVDYDVSYSMATISAVKNYDDSAIVVCHSNGVKRWSCNSPDCDYELQHYIDEDKISKNEIYKAIVDGDVWLNCKDENIKCEQETFYFKRLNQYLTILKFYREFD